MAAGKLSARPTCIGRATMQAGDAGELEAPSSMAAESICSGTIIVRAREARNGLIQE
jgi:hypothetical protein